MIPFLSLLSVVYSLSVPVTISRSSLLLPPRVLLDSAEERQLKNRGGGGEEEEESGKGKKEAQAMEYQKVSSPLLSKKLIDFHTISGKSMYDGVFAAPLTAGSRMKEEYSDIFGGSGASSIPVLDVPELNERKVSVDVRSSTLDYSSIFGGFGEFDSAVSHEELFAKLKKKDNRHEKPRSLAEAGSCTSNIQVENQEVSNNPAYQSFDRAKKFKMSYLKTSQGNKNGTNGTTHIAQLNAISGFTCLIDEVAPSQFTEAEKQLSTGLNDTFLDLNFDGGNMGNINAELIQPGDAIKQAHRGDSKLRSKTNQSRSNSKEKLFDAYEIDLRTQASKLKPPSSQPHNLACEKDDFERSTASKTGVYESHFGENAAGFSSPPYFGEEVDTNSAAAASAAAVKKAIEEAQARIEIARGIMERKKKGEKHVKPRCRNVSKAEERSDGEIEDKGNTYNEEVRKKFGKVGHTISVFTMPRTNNGSNVGHVTPDFIEREELFVIKEASGGMNAKEHNSTPVDCKLEKEDREAERWEDSGTEIVQPVSKCELEEEKYISKKTFVKAEENMKKIHAVEEEHKTKAEWTFNFNIIKGTCLFNECANTTNSGQQNSDQEAYGNSLRLLGETSMMCKAFHEVECGKNELIGVREIPENGKKLEVHDHRDDVCKEMKIKKEEQGWYANQKQQEGASEKEEAETMSAGNRQREQCEIGKEELSHKEENGINDGAACNKIDFVKQQKETCWMEETEERVEETHRTDAAEKTSGREQAWEKDEVTVDKFCEEDQNEGKLEECVDVGVEEKLMDTEKNEKLHKGTCKETEKREENYECNELTQDSYELSSNNSEAADDVFTLDQIKIPSETWETSGDEDFDEYLDAPSNEENGEITEVPLASFHSKEMKTESNAVEIADREEEKEIFKAEVASLPQEFLELYEIKGQVDSTVATLAFERNEISLGYTDKDVSQKQYDQHAVESRTFCNQEQHVDEFVRESEENFKDVDDSEVTFEQGDDEVDPKFSYEERSVDNEETVEEIQRPTVSTGEEETENIADKDKTCQNRKENKENHDRAPTSQETEAKCGSQNGVEPKKEPVRKIDETKEKEREKEKERMAVERAIREVRERAFAEARERAAAEKANAEARQRAMAEARERLDKASEEAKDKFSTEKASIEARLKAERAAVGRATAEARKRALEKAMSEKARNQGAKDSAASRNNGVRQSFSFNDSQYKGSGSHQSSGYPNSSSNDVNVESAQRHKAKLERHQRTAERAAKALAEKNMRDLLAQKEQQERNRLAEALDADVKRWSSGKEGNLRALLSTLQYILGPDSGWQPAPLTELIATTAVKKAYRRATLFVHPDKLQQRGATIQQKYICEKVFDLLKEAWNKFSKEER